MVKCIDKHKLKLTGEGVTMFEVKVYLFDCVNCGRILAYKKTPVKRALLEGGKIRWYHSAITWL